MLIWTSGRGALGAETLLMMPLTLPVATETPEVADGTVDDAVVTGVTVVAVEDDAMPTGYIPMLCVASPSPVVDDTVEVPVVPELGDGCLKRQKRQITLLIICIVLFETEEKRLSIYKGFFFY